MKNKYISQGKIIDLLHEFILYKAKFYTHNTQDKKEVLICFLEIENLRQIKPKDFTELRKNVNHIGKLGVLSIYNLAYLVELVKYFISKSGSFNPLLSKDELLDYYFSLTKKYKNNTIKRCISAYNGFCDFLNEKGIQAIKYKGLSLRFRVQKLPNFLNETQYNSFLDLIHSKKTESLRKLREKLIILLVAYTGIRTREVNNIKLSDIAKNNDSYVIKIQGKGSKERYVSINKNLIEETLEKFLAQKKARNIKTPYLMQLKSSNKKTKMGVDLKPYLQELDLVKDKGNYLHLLRHSFGSYVYGKTKDILLTQQSLGHASIESTQVYIHTSQEYYSRVAGLF